MERVGDFSLNVPGYYASKRALDRLGNALAPELAGKGIAVIGLMPGLVATEIVTLRVREEGLDDSVAVPMEVPARPHARLLRRVRRSDGIHRPPVLGRAGAQGAGA
jgi:short-subunit dehydrogenase